MFPQCWLISLCFLFHSSHLRGCLKEQLELVEPPHKQFIKRVGESRAIRERTKLEELREEEKGKQHRHFLSKFKDTNKMVSSTIILVETPLPLSGWGSVEPHNCEY